MGPKEFSKKLKLNKNTVANLDKEQLNSVYGGEVFSKDRPYTECVLCVVSWDTKCPTDTIMMFTCNPDYC